MGRNSFMSQSVLRVLSSSVIFWIVMFLFVCRHVSREKQRLVGNVNASWFSPFRWRRTIAGSPGSRSQDLGSTGSEKSMDKMASTRTEVAS